MKILDDINRRVLDVQTGRFAGALNESLKGLTFDGGFDTFLDRLKVESATAMWVLENDAPFEPMFPEGRCRGMIKQAFGDLLFDSHAEKLIKPSFAPHTVLSEAKYHEQLIANTHVVTTLAPIILYLAQEAHDGERRSALKQGSATDGPREWLPRDLQHIYHRACGFAQHLLNATGLEFSKDYVDALKAEIFEVHRSKSD